MKNVRSVSANAASSKEDNSLMPMFSAMLVFALAFFISLSTIAGNSSKSTGKTVRFLERGNSFGSNVAANSAKWNTGKSVSSSKGNRHAVGAFKRTVIKIKLNSTAGKVKKVRRIRL